jgi:HAD superfamily hydrolase (TIGR01450 family)
MSKPNSTSVLLCDLDGVVWLAHQPIPGAVDAISRVREAGTRVLFVTNNSFSTRLEQVDALGKIGISAQGDVVTSAMSAATAVKPGWRVLVCGGRGLIEEVERVGATPVVAYQSRPVSGSFDAVVVGFHREFDFQVLSDALSAVRNGALLVGSNDDPTYPTPHGPIPGGGAILAAVEKATGVNAVVTGKPNEPMAQLVREMCSGVAPSEMVMVGDRPDTDGAFAQTLGCPYALVLSGVTTTEHGSGAQIVAQHLGGVVDILLGS